MAVFTVFISAGSNQGDSHATFERAEAQLFALPRVISHKESPVYVTEPQDDPDQPWFHNKVLEITLQIEENECTEAVAITFLEALSGIENELGRVRAPTRRFAPRVIDLDVLLFGNLVMDAPKLCLPHKRMLDRAFVLVPLYDLDPMLVFPDGQTISEAMSKIHFKVLGNKIFQ